MICDYWETFCRLVPVRMPDDLGGTDTAWTEDTYFAGGVIDAAGTCVTPGGLPTLQTQTMLLHSPEITLGLHDRVRRLRDGAEYLVTGSSDDRRTPPCAALAYACVPVERLVTAV